MKAHKKLWESVTLLPTKNWLDSTVTTEDEFKELNIPENFPDPKYGWQTDLNEHMFALFAALMFGGELDV